MQSKWKWKDSVELTNGLQWLNETFVWSMFFALYLSVANNSHRRKPLGSGNVAILNEKHLGSSRHLKGQSNSWFLTISDLTFSTSRRFPQTLLRFPNLIFRSWKKTLCWDVPKVWDRTDAVMRTAILITILSDTKHDNFNWLFSICYNSALSREAWRQIKAKWTQSMHTYFSSLSLQLASRHAAGFFYAPCQRESNVNLISCSDLRSWLVLLAPIWYR